MSQARSNPVRHVSSSSRGKPLLTPRARPRRQQGKQSTAADLGYSPEGMEGEFVPAVLSIEADGDFDSGHIDVDDEDLNAAFEADSSNMFQTSDKAGSSRGKHTHSVPSTKSEKKFVIPKLKQSGNESLLDVSNSSSGEEGKREWRKNEREVRSRDYVTGRKDTERDHGKTEAAENHGKSQAGAKKDLQHRHPTHRSGSKPESRPSIFESFADQSLTDAETKDDEQLFQEADKEKANVEEEEQAEEKEPEEEEESLDIPMDRDSLIFAREYYPWQIRLYPVSKADMTRSDFAVVWAMSDSSSIVWSDNKDFGGVAEFLLKNHGCIQKFMRRILWHSFESDVISVEVTERGKSETTSTEQGSTDTHFDTIISQVVFRFHNARARQLIKTYYPTPKGEVTERSVYVNNVNSGQSSTLLRAVFPCAAKINVAKSGEEDSSVSVETESAEEAFNYMVVYLEIRIDDTMATLSTANCDWEEAIKKFKSQHKNVKETPKPPLLKTPGSKLGKRTSSSTISSVSAKRGRGGTSQIRTAASVRTASTGFVRPSRGAVLGGRGRGGRPRGGGSGRTLLPNPVGGGDGLLPLPASDSAVGGGDGLLPLPPPERSHPPSLLAVSAKPTSQGLRDGDRMVAAEPDLHPSELREIRQHLESQVRETRAQLQSHLSQLDHAVRIGASSRLRRPADYLEEEERPRETPRRTLLALDSRPRLEREEWPVEAPSEYRPSRSVRPLVTEPSSDYPRTRVPPRASAVEREYEARSLSRDRRDEDYGDVRYSVQPRPYLLEAPESSAVREEKDDREVYDYGHSYSHSRLDLELARVERPLLSRASVSDRDRLERSAYLEERVPRARDTHDYEARVSRQALAYRGYEEDARRAQPTIRYADEYDRRY